MVKDKAVKRYQVRNMVDASSQRDIRDASVYPTFMLPKLYMKMQYCVSCAIHGRIVRVRNRKLRASPEGRIFVRPSFGGKGGGKGAGGGAGGVVPRVAPPVVLLAVVGRQGELALMAEAYVVFSQTSRCMPSYGLESSHYNGAVSLC